MGRRAATAGGGGLITVPLARQSAWAGAVVIELTASRLATGAVSRYLAEFFHEPAFLAAFVRRCLPFALGLPWLASALVVPGTWHSDRSSVTMANLLVVTVVMATAVPAVVLFATGLNWRLPLRARPPGIFAAALRDRQGRLICLYLPRATILQARSRNASLPDAQRVNTVGPQ